MSNLRKCCGSLDSLVPMETINTAPINLFLRFSRNTSSQLRVASSFYIDYQEWWLCYSVCILGNFGSQRGRTDMVKARLKAGSKQNVLGLSFKGLLYLFPILNSSFKFYSVSTDDKMLLGRLAYCIFVSTHKSL